MGENGIENDCAFTFAGGLLDLFDNQPQIAKKLV
jgi:hypothetical protein